VNGALGSIRQLLELSVARRDIDAFLTALGRLGPACHVLLPRQADDENELCDDVA
jgi:hypothetical protein